MPQLGATGKAGYGAVTIGISAALILAQSITRSSAIIKNNHASNILYIGDDASVTTSTGFPVGPGESFSVEDFAGPVYGIANAAGTDVRTFGAGTP